MRLVKFVCKGCGRLVNFTGAKEKDGYIILLGACGACGERTFLDVKDVIIALTKEEADPVMPEDTNRN